MRTPFRYQYILDCASDTGRTRDNNEDSVTVLSLKGFSGGINSDLNNTNIAVLAVADGVGGGPAGEVASRSSIAFFCRSFIGSMMSFSNLQEARKGMIDLIHESFQFAHNEVSRSAVQNPSYVGMASTLTVAVLADSHCYIGHVGDSRCYLIRSGRIKQLSMDHNAAGSKSMISQAIGAMSISTFTYELLLENNDVLLLCSDGLSNYVSDEEIASIVNSEAKDISLASRRLIEAANERGGGDNVTVALGKVSVEIV